VLLSCVRSDARAFGPTHDLKQQDDVSSICDGCPFLIPLFFVSGGTRVGLYEYTFPSRDDVLSYLEDHLKCPADVSARIYTSVGGHLGEVGKLTARFQGSEPSPSDIDGERFRFPRDKSCHRL
jgi:hypothetical protein